MVHSARVGTARPGDHFGAERPHGASRLPRGRLRDGRGQAAGAVRPGRVAAARSSPRTDRVRAARAERPAGADHPRSKELLEQHVPGSAEGTAGPLPETPVARRSLDRATDRARQTAVGSLMARRLAAAVLVAATAANHSARSACAGSMRSARRTGSQCAARATAVRTAAAPANVTGSTGLTPKIRLPRKRVAISAATTPAPTPVATRTRPLESARRSTSARCAPTAIRTPTSRVRWATPYDTTP